MRVIRILAAVAIVSALSACEPVCADGVPAAAARYHRTLVRSVHAEWGLQGPVSTFAAQVHQESRWNARATSGVGAKGLAQFMPATGHWFARLYPHRLGPARPFNPGWALRGLVLYDRWLHQRVSATQECDRWAMTLSAYNGGLGWVYRDQKLASANGADKRVWFDSVERYNAGRSAAQFHENRQYPRLILLRWEPLYERAGWGPGVCP